MTRLVGLQKPRLRKEKGMEKLPELFLSRMREMLGEEYQAFLDSYDSPRVQGLRLNDQKQDKEMLEKICRR